MMMEIRPNKSITIMMTKMRSDIMRMMTKMRLLRKTAVILFRTQKNKTLIKKIMKCSTSSSNTILTDLVSNYRRP